MSTYVPIPPAAAYGSLRSQGRQKCQLFFCLAAACCCGCCGLSSLFSSLTFSESRGHSHENWSLAHWAALMRAACLIGLATGTGTFSVSTGGGGVCSVRSETCCHPSVGGGSGGCCLAASAAAMLLRRSRSR